MEWESPKKAATVTLMFSYFFTFGPVATLLSLLRKRRVMKVDVNVSNVRKRWAGC
jgi:hypothetical protein